MNMRLVREFLPKITTGPWSTSNDEFKQRVHSQNASVVALLVHLVDDVIDEDLEVFHSVVVNDVAHVGYENRLLHPVLQIHQKPANVVEKETNTKCATLSRTFPQVVAGVNEALPTSH